MKRGEVVLVDFPFHDGSGSKVRPALVVQHDRDNKRLANTILVMISGNLKHAGHPANLLIDPATAEGASSGLHGPSLLKCNNLHSIPQNEVIRVVGTLSPPLMLKVDECLKAALNLT